MHCSRCGTPLQDDWDRCLFCEGLASVGRSGAELRPSRSPDLHHRVSFWVAAGAVTLTIAGALLVLFAPQAWLGARRDLALLDGAGQDPQYRAHAVETVEHYCAHLRRGEKLAARELLDAARPVSALTDDEAVPITGWSVEQVAADPADARVHVVLQVGPSPVGAGGRTAVFRLRPKDGVWRIYEVRVTE
jgi:hypothetical protein